jgi:multiple sugar transport system substrate-binding protein
MSRPQTEAEYLARFPVAPVSGMSRRSLLGGALALGALGLAACSSGGTATSGAASPGGAPTGEITFGNNQADPVPKAAIEAAVKAFQTANPGLTVKLNTVAHTTFQENINNYLQGSPTTPSAGSPVTGRASSPRRTSSATSPTCTRRRRASPRG